VTDLLLRPWDDLDPSLVHRLEPLGLHLGILVWDGAGEWRLPSTILWGCGATTILSTSISVSARLSSPTDPPTPAEMLGISSFL
jgi:hypothetical protein